MIAAAVLTSPLPWEETEPGQADRLHASLELRSEPEGLVLRWHLTAIEVDGEDYQRAVNPDHEDELDQWSAAAGDACFETTEINGRHYVVFASAWSA